MSIPEDDTNPKIFACLKHLVRRRILLILSQGPKSFSDLQDEFKIESSRLSYHLNSLGSLLYRTSDGKYALSHVGEVALSMIKEGEELHIAPLPPRIVVQKNQKNPRKYFKLGKFQVPSWAIAVLMVSIISSGVLGSYLWNTFTVPLQINEPIEIVGYPTQWSLYPGETAQFNVTVINHASLNYSVILDFKASDMTYQQRYLTFSDENYTVITGQQNLGAWLNVSADAPAADLNVTVTVLRVVDGYASNLLLNGDFETGSLLGWNTEGAVEVTSQVVHSGQYAAYVSDQELVSRLMQNISLPADAPVRFEAWIYPLRVGSMGPLDKPYSSIWLQYCFKNSGLNAFAISYTWCWNTLNSSKGGDTFNTTTTLCFRLDFQSAAWNNLSRNVTSEVQQYFTSYNLSDIVLQQVICDYHYSNGSPGPFYVDDLSLST